ncbi:MAG TPA: YraN family protein, partial [Thermodesulforhabdus norvegica]|nr:YraN family protein [Thermodesulforhabdus norvegica]
MFRKSKGKQSEDVAAQFLRQKGLKIINKNVQTRFGEIDIVALDRNTIVFVEVRSVYG